VELFVKALISGVVVVAASEAARRSSLLGAVLISLPLTSILALAWLYAGTRDTQKVVDLSWAILWIVVPSLVFFAAVPLLVRLGAGVPVAIVAACGITACAYAGWIVLLRAAGAGV